MAKRDENNHRSDAHDDINRTSVPGGPGVPDSLSDSASDEERLKQEMSFTVLPEVNDIPGQEQITNAGFPGAMSDTTISSDDEEGIRDGRDVVDEDDDFDIVMGTEADVTKEDLLLLGDKDQDQDMDDDELIGTTGLDDTDFEGDVLNEASGTVFSTGEDLDVPEGGENDPGSDAAGEADEENSYYSLGSDNNDEMVEGTP